MAKHSLETSIVKVNGKNIWRKFIKAVKTFELISYGDNIAVCVSGGKSSMLMAKMLKMVSNYKMYNIQLKFMIIDIGFSEKQIFEITNNANRLAIQLEFISVNVEQLINFQQLFQVILEKAQNMGCNKIALGHNFNVLTEEILKGVLFNGNMQGNLPKTKIDKGVELEIIRPLFYIDEQNIDIWCRENKLVFLEDKWNKSSEYLEVKKIIKDLTRKNAAVEKNIFGSIDCVNLRNVTGYKKGNSYYHFLDEY